MTLSLASYLETWQCLKCTKKIYLYFSKDCVLFIYTFAQLINMEPTFQIIWKIAKMEGKTTLITSLKKPPIYILTYFLSCIFLCLCFLVVILVCRSFHVFIQYIISSVFTMLLHNLQNCILMTELCSSNDYIVVIVPLPTLLNILVIS